MVSGPPFPAISYLIPRKQKALFKLAHARIFNNLHKRNLAEGNHTAAATLLSTAATGAMNWVTFNDQLFKADTLSGDISGGR